MNRIYYLMGKSASGKDTLYRRLLEDSALKLLPMVIYTTRPIRSGEQDGVDYHFTDEAHLQQLLEEGRVVELRQYNTVHGVWSYFTVDDFGKTGKPGKSGRSEEPGKSEEPGRQEESADDYLGIGTLESFLQIRNYYGAERVVPLYIEVEDGLRLSRALSRERAQAVPRYEELCRRFLADQKDFSEEKLQEAGIHVRFSNDQEPGACFGTIRRYILEAQGR